MTSKEKTLKELSKEVTNDIDKDGNFKNSITIPGIDNLAKYMEDLETPEQRETFRNLVKRKVLKDVFPTNAKAVFDDPTRNKIIAQNSHRVEPQCKICKSPFYTVYMEWTTIDNKSAVECSALAKIVFDENISLKTFRNHNKNHLMNKQLIRKAMIRQDPNVDPIREATALVQLLMDDVVIDEEINLKKAKMVFQGVKIIEDAKAKRMKHNVEGDLNITQINIDQQGLPRSTDSMAASQRMLTDEERQRLEELGSIFKKKGTAAIRRRIPEKPFEVKKDKTEIAEGVIFED